MVRPTCVIVPSGSRSIACTGALRIAIFATHSLDQIDRLVDEIRQFGIK